jgi:hypothetical protein
MSESELHRLLRNALIDTLQAFYVDEPLVHVTGDVLLFYEKGNRRKHLAPDLFIAFGVGKHIRDNYLMWEEAPPSVVLELTSPTTRADDLGPKFALYRDELKVKEYFLFDPKEDLISPSMQGWRLAKGQYRAIRPVAGRLPSRELGLHLEREGNRAYLWNPDTGRRLLSPAQQAEEARERAEEARERAEESREQAEDAREQAEAARGQAESEIARLRRLLEQAGIPFDAGVANLSGAPTLRGKLGCGGRARPRLPCRAGEDHVSRTRLVRRRPPGTTARPLRATLSGGDRRRQRRPGRPGHQCQRGESPRPLRGPPASHLSGRRPTPPRCRASGFPPLHCTRRRQSLYRTRGGMSAPS